MIRDIKVVVTPFMQNARIVYPEGGTAAIVIDPGGDAEAIHRMLDKHKLVCEQIWLTHSHLDHCGGVQDLIEITGATLYAHKDEKIMREKVIEIARMYGIPDGYFKNCPEPQHYIAEGDRLQFHGLEFEVLFTPGHSPGHVSFYCREHNVIISGDVLFAGGIGRVDLPGGDYSVLMQSINKKLLTLPDHTKVWCGHGDDTTIGAERTGNPFLN